MCCAERGALHVTVMPLRGCSYQASRCGRHVTIVTLERTALAHDVANTQRTMTWFHSSLRPDQMSPGQPRTGMRRPLLKEIERCQLGSLACSVSSDSARCCDCFILMLKFVIECQMLSMHCSHGTGKTTTGRKAYTIIVQWLRTCTYVPEELQMALFLLPLRTIL